MKPFVDPLVIVRVLLYIKVRRKIYTLISYLGIIKVTEIRIIKNTVIKELMKVFIIITRSYYTTTLVITLKISKR